MMSATGCGLARLAAVACWRMNSLAGGHIAYSGEKLGEDVFNVPPRFI